MTTYHLLQRRDCKIINNAFILEAVYITTQLRLAPETEDERRARLEYLSDNPIYIPNNLYLILIVAF